MPNGRRRKKSILSLELGGNNVTVQGQIRGAIYDYYKMLFGRQQDITMKLGAVVWSNQGGYRQ
jgi:hypothetical protein